MSNKVWFITGSSRGLGLELAKAVLAAGDRLVATARNPQSLSGLVEQYGDRVRAVELDVTSSQSARAAVASALAAFGRLDVVVNNAGYANVNSIEDVAEDDFRAQVETNFFGVVNVTRAVLPVLREQRSGHLIQISSVGGRSVVEGFAAYQASKFAVNGFSEVLAKEVAAFGIHVTIAEPGGMRTEWAGSSMRVDEIQPAYQATVGALAQHMRNNSDVAQSDPSKVAQALLAVSAEAKPPLRLLLGSDAVFLAELAAKSRAREDAQWNAVSLSSDVAGMPPFHETPIAQYLLSRSA